MNSKLTAPSNGARSPCAKSATKVTSASPIIKAEAVDALRASDPRATSPTARTSTTTAVTGPKRAQRDGGSTAPSRTAAIGGTRVARRAGRRLASNVIRVPTSSETMIVRVAKTVVPCGRLMLIAMKEAVQPLRGSGRAWMRCRSRSGRDTRRR